MKNSRRRGQNRITLADVAEKAGVSAITVSRVVNESSGVSPPLRQKVESVISELGYIPNRSASNLASSRSKVIGVLIPSLSNVVFNEVLRGIYDVAVPARYQVLLADTHYSLEEEERSIRALLGQSPEGLILTGGDQSPAAKRMLEAAHIPIVQIMERLETPLDMNIGLSHGDAAYDLTKALLARGHANIGFIGARMDPRSCQRLDGYKAALSEVDGFDERFVVTSHEPSSVGLGGELLKKMFSRSGGECDAVFCCNDDLAMGVLFECQRMKISVPEKLGICGFNDIDSLAFLYPSLSSVRVARYEMGAKALKMIFDRLDDKENIPSKIDAGYELMLRGSTK